MARHADDLLEQCKREFRQLHRADLLVRMVRNALRGCLEIQGDLLQVDRTCYLFNPTKTVIQVQLRVRTREESNSGQLPVSSQLDQPGPTKYHHMLQQY